MKPIKFRWRTKDGETQFAQFEVFDGKLYLKTEENNKPLATNVNPTSLSQFVGYDYDGNEIYESDEFNDKYGHTLTARLNPQAVTNNGHLRFDWLPDNCEFHAMPDDFNVEEDYINEHNYISRQKT